MTYSLATVGIPADSVPDAKTLLLDDANGGTVTAQMQSASLGRQVLCQNPDGSQSYYTIDASTFRPGLAPTMLKVR